LCGFEDQDTASDMIAFFLFGFCSLLCWTTNNHFHSFSLSITRQRAAHQVAAGQRTSLHLKLQEEDSGDNNESKKCDRQGIRGERSRRAMIEFANRSLVAGSLGGVAWGNVGVQNARAEDPLFKKNPLTNKFLEKVRAGRMKSAS
jgi:hypothetical protein